VNFEVYMLGLSNSEGSLLRKSVLINGCRGLFKKGCYFYTWKVGSIMDAKCCSKILGDRAIGVVVLGTFAEGRMIPG